MLTAAEVDQYRVIDTDTHVVEPYDLWTSRLPARWRDQAPHVKWDENHQEDAWYFGTERIGPAASAAQAGWREYPPDHPPRLADVDAATWDAKARLARMDEYGVWAQVLYPNVAGFGAGKLLTLGDSDLMLACVRAYNDFLVEYASADPRRFIPIMALPMWDMELCEQEIVRAASAGHKGVIMTGEPTFWGLPPIAESYWDRLWALCQEMELPVNFHIGSGDMSIFDHAAPSAGPHANYAGFGVQFGTRERQGHRQPDHRRRLPPVPRHQVRVGGKRRRLDPVRARAPGLAVAELRRPARAPGVRPAAKRVLQAPDVRLLLVRAGVGQVRDRPAGPGLDLVRERLPAPDQHGAGPGHRRRGTA